MAVKTNRKYAVSVQDESEGACQTLQGHVSGHEIQLLQGISHLEISPAPLESESCHLRLLLRHLGDAAPDVQNCSPTNYITCSVFIHSMPLSIASRFFVTNSQALIPIREHHCHIQTRTYPCCRHSWSAGAESTSRQG